MNVYLISAGMLSILMALTHSILGERLILIPLHRRTDILGTRTKSIRATLRFAWHVTSVFGLGIAAILFRYARFASLNADHIYVLRTLSITFLVCFAVALVGSQGRHLSWAVFLAMAVLTWLSTQ